MVEYFSQGDEVSDYDEEDVLIQFWEASIITTEEGRKYWELTTHNKPFYIIYDAGGYHGGLSSYRNESVCRTIIIQDDDDDDDGDDDDGDGDYDEGDQLQIIISRVFRNKRPERNISYYAEHKYSWYIPIYETAGDYCESPCGVMEYVSTCEEYLEKFRLYLGLTCFGQNRKMYMYGNHLYGFGRQNILKHSILEMDQLVTVVCQKFPLPLAQYWVTTHPHTEPLRVMYQQSHTEMKILKLLDKFKNACLEMRLNKYEGLVGTAYRSHKTFFCNDIKEVSITNQCMAQYASCNMSIACFVICLNHIYLEGTKCVLEFFLPSQEIMSYNPQTMLNSLWATMENHLPSFMSASGERLGQVLSVEVIDFATHNEPELFKLGEWKSSLPRQEYEGHPSHESSHLCKLLFEEEDEHIVDICSTTNSCNETATRETSERAGAHDNIAEIIHSEKSKEESSIKCIETQSLTNKSKRSKENLNDVGNAEEIDHSALETTMELAIKHKEHTVAADKGDFTVDELVEGPPIVDIGYNMSSEDVPYTVAVDREELPIVEIECNMSNEEVRYTMNTASQKSCQEVHTLNKEIKPQEDISLECLREHFGRPLDDAAASFGVSRSTFKRICRGHGIKRWQYGKRTMGNNISSNLRRKLNNEEPSRRNFSRSGMPSSQDTSQHSNKMTVKAMYNGITIRFELPDLSGIAELEDNVIERLHLERKSFSIKYQDDEDDWILIACDKDVQECMEISRSLKKTTIKMSIDPPIINHYAP